MRIFVTGGTGFFGQSLLQYLHNTLQHCYVDFSVTLLSRDPNSYLRRNPHISNYTWLCLHKGDILNQASFPSNHKFSHVIHAATDSTHGPTLSGMDQFEQIVGGTRNVLEFAQKQHVKRFLYVSSGAIYGSQPENLDLIPESWAGSPDLANTANTYGIGKRSAEHLCHVYRKTHALDVVIARCFAFVGANLPLNVHFAIGNFIRDALFEQNIIVAGDGSGVRSYLEESDLATWLVTLLLHGHSGEAYNVGSDKAVSIKELAHLVRKLLAPEKEVQILGRPQASGSRSRYVPDISKARKELGLEVRIPLAEAIIRTAAAHKGTQHLQ